MELNPFAVSYITEASYTPKELLERYSFLPFLQLQRLIGSPTNVFVLGRRGVGKTMLLKLFDPDLMEQVYVSSSQELTKVRRFIPPATVGVYLNLSSPDSKLNLFQGHDRDSRWWMLAFSDYLNCVLLKGALRSIDRMTLIKPWCEAAGLRRRDWRDGNVIRKLVEDLRQESSAFDKVKNRKSLDSFLEARIGNWRRFLNNDRSAKEPPETPLPLGVPLFRLTECIRREGLFSHTFRLFVLIDQYENLYHRRSVIDYRPVFNEAMYAASRGGTGVEFKLGARRYSSGDLRFLDGDGKIEESREVIELDLDREATRFFRLFAIDLFRKRLQVSGVRCAKAVQLAAERLPALTSRREAELYLGKEKEDIERPKHFAPFLDRWEMLGVERTQAERMLSQCGLSTAHPLTATLTCIALTRWLRDRSRFPPVGCREMEIIGELDLYEAIGSYARELGNLIESRYRGPAENKAIDNFVRDAEQVALFILASSYKNQKKYFTGIESIIRISSNVALVFIEILGRCYDLLLFDGGNPSVDPVEPSTQSTAIHAMSEAWHRQMPTQVDFAESLQALVTGLGVNFRKLQLEPSAPDPSPNGFSISNDQRTELMNAGDNPREDPRRLLLEAVGWGVLEEKTHRDKSRGKAPRTKFYLNRILCPYFLISDIEKKDPMYVYDLERFINDIVNSREPSEVSARLRRSRGEANSIVARQPSLFQGK
jgi:hypothetical protein